MQPDAIVGAAAAALQAGRFDEAIGHARSAIARTPGGGQAHAILALALERCGRIGQARAAICNVEAGGIADAEACDAVAFTATRLGQYELANRLYRRAVEIEPDEYRFWHSLGTSERSRGRLDAAEAAFDRAIALRPDDYPAYPLRSDLHVQDRDRNHVDALRHALSGRLPDRGRMFLAFALAKELDDLGEIRTAFRWFAEGNRIRRRNLDYDVATDVHKMARIGEVFSPGLLAASGADGDSERFIFILGLPRSGTTLVERILTAHENVGSNGETENFSHALLASCQTGGGDIFVQAASANFEAVASTYERLATEWTSERTIIEKLPLNYLYSGPIHLALPKSRILWVRRSALDVCFAMYRTLFGQGYPFSYDLREIASYYAAYVRLMRHWMDAMPGRLHIVDYRALVDAPVAVGRSLTEYCGIEWNETALDPERNPRISMTASAAQIRRPIYRTSTDRWVNYADFLTPLIEELEQQGVDVDEW